MFKGNNFIQFKINYNLYFDYFNKRSFKTGDFMKKIFKNFFEPLFLGVILIDIAFLISTTFFTLPSRIENFILVFDFFVCILIMIEFCYNLMKSDNKKKFLISHWYELIAAIPIDLFLFRFFRLIRIFRLFKLIKIIALFKTDFKLIKRSIEHTNLLRLVIIILFLVISSTISLVIMDPNMSNFLVALWYVISTVTSVGYGDITPSSNIGRIIGIFLVVIGFILLGVFIGEISSIYQNKSSSKNELLELVKNQNNDISDLKKEIKELKNMIEDK